MRCTWVLVAVGCGTSSPEEPPGSDGPVGDAVEDVATGLDEPGALAVDATHVYFTQRGGIVARVAKAGGAVTAIAAGQRSPGSLDASTDQLCWVNSGTHAMDFRDGSVRCAPKTGGADVEIAPSYFPSSLAIHDGTIYWAEIDGQRVRAIGLDGSTARTLDNAPTSKVGIAVSPDKLAWTATGPDDDVVLVDRATGARTALSTTEYAPGAIQIGGDAVYWVTRHALSNAGAVRVSRAGETSDLVPDEYAPVGLVRAGEALYWTSGGRIRGYVDGAAQTLVTDRGAIWGLVGDDEYLYWSEPDRGALVRLRR